MWRRLRRTDDPSRSERQRLALDSLDGLSVGDALGERFFGWRHTSDDLRAGWLPPAPWTWTDDTCMASTLTAHVIANDGIAQDQLAREFARDFDIGRGFGPSVRGVLAEIERGAYWSSAARAPFGGTGSCGNGSAMRVAPLGAWHLGDLGSAAAAAALSAEVTHPHPEGIAGAIAIACAASYVAGERAAGRTPAPTDVLAVAVEHTPDSDVRERVRQATTLPPSDVDRAAAELGTGREVTCQDTVAFCVWVAAHHLDDYPAAIAGAVQGRGDVDTTCAIVGGVVGAFTGVGGREGVHGVPRPWLSAREQLPRAVARLH